jgi:predicted CXXCH cytochrome family protein
MRRSALISLCAALGYSLVAVAVHAEANPPADGTVTDTTAAPPAEPKCPRSIAVTDCAPCHGGKLPIVDRKRFESSAHFKKAGMDCDSCHTASAEYPHGKDSLPSCLDCHDAEAFKKIGEYASKSVHFQMKGREFGCLNCHSEHYVKLAAEMPLAEKNGMCRQCHTDESLKQIHSWHPLAPMHLKNTACIACHTQPAAGVPGMAFKHNILQKSRASRACEDCHKPGGKMLQYLETFGTQPRLELGSTELFKHFYLGGATRVPWVERIGFALMILALLGVSLHGLARKVSQRRKP